MDMAFTREYFSPSALHKFFQEKTSGTSPVQDEKRNYIFTKKVKRKVRTISIIIRLPLFEDLFISNDFSGTMNIFLACTYSHPIIENSVIRTQHIAS